VETLLLLITTPLFIIFILAEMIFSHFYNKKLYSKGDTAINLMCTSLNFINDLVFRGITLAILLFFNEYAFMTIENKGFSYWILLFLAQDFAYYVLHYADHYCRLFWATHVTHHSSQKFNLTVAIRSSVFQPYYRFLFYIPLALFGFEALDIVFMYAVCQAYGFFVHTETVGKLGWLEYILVTPSHHRVHHASNAKYLDSNMGMVLIIWDRIFGTFVEEDINEPVKYGLTKNLDEQTPVNVVFHEWVQLFKDVKNAPDWNTKFMYIFGPPGYSHDGSRQTSTQMKAAIQGIADEEQEQSIFPQA
jgi:sterol desaturase/sphingolipid hydroxylase (fatty acid hydroxylase superfamily)